MIRNRFATFQKINALMHFSIDLFASYKNAKCKRFYSNFWCQNTLGIDAFCHDWSGETAWICPPVRCITRVIQKIKKSTICGVLFVPEWQTADFWPQIMDQDQKPKHPFTQIDIHRPFLIQEDFHFRSPFTGFTEFNFLAVNFF